MHLLLELARPERKTQLLNSGYPAYLIHGQEGKVKQASEVA